MSELYPQQPRLLSDLNTSHDSAKLLAAAHKMGLVDEPFGLSDGKTTANVWFTSPSPDGSEVGIIADLDDKGIWVGHVPTADLLPQLSNPTFNSSIHEARILYHANYPAGTMGDAVRYISGPLFTEVESERAVTRSEEFQVASRTPASKISLNWLEEAFVFASAIFPPRLSRFLIRTVLRGTVEQLEDIPVPALPG